MRALLIALVAILPMAVVPSANASTVCDPAAETELCLLFAFAPGIIVGICDAEGCDFVSYQRGHDLEADSHGNRPTSADFHTGNLTLEAHTDGALFPPEGGPLGFDDGEREAHLQWEMTRGVLTFSTRGDQIAAGDPLDASLRREGTQVETTFYSCWRQDIDGNGLHIACGDWTRNPEPSVVTDLYRPLAPAQGLIDDIVRFLTCPPREPCPD